MANASKSGVTTITTPSDREVLIERVVDAPQQPAWDLFTKPEHVKQWLLGPPGWEMPICEIDLRVGGAWRYVYAKHDGQAMTLSGTYIDVVPIDYIISTESWGPQWPSTLNTARFTPAGEQTIIAITVKYDTEEARDAALKTAMGDGLNAGFTRLDDLIASLAK